MTDHLFTITYVPIELVGGPNDGHRIMWIAPPPPVIIVPLPNRLHTQVAYRDLSPPSVPGHVRIGEYRPRDEQTYERVVVSRLEIELAKHDVLNVLLDDVANPFLYDWCGEG